MIVSIILLDYLMKLSKWRVRGIPPLPPALEDVKDLEIVVIVPFRDESDHLPHLLQDLSLQTESCHVIFVDDHSLDRGAEIIANQLPFQPNWRLLRADGEGKKAAIRTALDSSMSTYVITLDADVRLKEAWFEELSAFLFRVRPVMAILPVRLSNEHSVLGRLQDAEWKMISAITAGSALAGEPILCNGAHLAFHRDVIAEIMPNEHSVSSGDDMFLLEKAKQMGPVYFYATESVSVLTKSASTWASFFAQRVRWAGKTHRFRDRDIIGFGLRTTLVQLIQLFLPLFIWKNPDMIWFAIAWIYVKWSAELGYTYNYCRIVNIRWSFISSWVVVILYPLYSILVAAIALVYRPKWKGRKIKQ
ncbi:MAG: glycosyltransferase [Flavobacteriales bacterium]